MIPSIDTLVNRGINVSGYAQAQRHYDTLKKRLISQVTQNIANNRNAQMQYLQSISDDIEKDLLNDAQSSEEMSKKAEQLLNKVESMVIHHVNGNNSAAMSEVRTVLQAARDGQRKKDVTKEKADELLKNRIKDRQKKILELLPFRTVVPRLHISTQGADKEDIMNQLTSFYTRVLYQQTIDANFKVDKTHYIQSLKGYYAEMAEYKALTRYFNDVQSGMTVHHTGAKKIGGKDTELDLIISDLENVQDIMQRNFSINEKIISLKGKDLQQILKDLQEGARWFGEQSKSWSLTSQSFRYNIGQRTQLLNAFSSEGGNLRSALQGIQFMARQQSILLALGATNVLINTGGARQWMGDFIHSFRQQGYLLGFAGGNTSDLTSHIILTRLYNKSIATYGVSTK